MADSFRSQFGGVREIQPDISKPSFQVKCTPTVGLIPMGTLVTVIQQNLLQDQGFFDRTIQDFKDGFGDVAGDHFIGLDKIHLITSSSAYDMIMAMVNIYGSDLDFDKYIYMKYYNFQISDFSKKYKMSVSSSGALFTDYYDQLEYLNGTSFSAKDDDNDGIKFVNCAAVNNHGFWYNAACNGCVLKASPCYLDDRVIVTMALIPRTAN
ncbi:hypothetical protein SNE40_000497 [Patella caerulea]|uniref:Fibrinogen C-terminal domain-containing protein n=1 Tax=Patella caerulea TaxID=87958 RepID=A0AAN8KDZ3_PATCE